MDDHRRSSILKQQKHRSPLTPLDVEEEPDTTLAKQSRRVSFASSNFVKQFTADPEKNTIWDSTYEESVSHTVDSSSQSSNKDTQSCEMELTQCVQQEKSTRRGTICFTDGEDIEIDEEIFENLPPELAVDKENLLFRKRKLEQNEDMEYFREKRTNMSDMEFTEVIPKREEIVRSVVMYRNVEETCMMMDDVKNVEEELEFTECIPLREIVQNEPEELDFTECIQGREVVENVLKGETTIGVDTRDNIEETACIGRIKNVSEVNFHETTVPELTSMRLDYTACMNEDTQMLINCNLSNNSKNKPHSEFSRIIAGDYNPSPMNSKLMAMCDLSSANYSEQMSRCHVSLPIDNYDDSVHAGVVNDLPDKNQDDSINEGVADLSRKDVDCLNISQEMCVSLSPLPPIIPEEQDTPVVEQDFIKEALGQLIEMKPIERILKPKYVNNWVLKMKSLDDEFKKLLKVAQNRLLTHREKNKVYSIDSESSQNSTITEELLVEDVSLLDSTSEKEAASIMDKILEKAKQSKFYWQITIGNENKCTVSTLFGAVLSILDFDNTSGRIDSILTSVRIKADTKPIARYVLRLFERKLSPELLVSCLGQHYDILSFLDYIQMTFLHFMKVFDEYNELAKECAFEMHENMSVTFIMINKELMLAWDVEVNFTDEHLNEDSVKVSARVGTVNERAVKKCINGCPQGFSAFRPFITNIKNYMSSLKRPLKH